MLQSFFVTNTGDRPPQLALPFINHNTLNGYLIMKKYIFPIIVSSLFLSGCQTVLPKKNTTPARKTEMTATPVSNDNQTAQDYIRDKQTLSQGIVIASSRNACVDGFNFLKGMNQTQFTEYSADYAKINQNYTFLSVNKEIMDKDSKELLTMTLNKKLDTLCAKVQYASYQGVKDRLKSLSDI